MAEVRNESNLGVWRRAFWLPRVAVRRSWMPAFAGKTVVLVRAFWVRRVTPPAPLGSRSGSGKTDGGAVRRGGWSVFCECMG